MKESGTPKRFATLDFYRGLSIWLMAFMHVFHHLYDYTWIIENPEAALSIPLYVLIPVGFLGYLGSWNTFFILISAAVNALVMTKKAKKGGNKQKILIRQVITGLTLIILGQAEIIFGYWGYFGTCIRENYCNLQHHWHYSFTVIHTLQIIGWSMLLNAVVHYFLMLKNGNEKHTRNMIIYLVLAVLVMFFTPFIQQLYDNFTFEGTTFRRWMWVTLAGHIQPIFPCLSTSFVGSIIGIHLSKPNPSKKFFYFGVGSSFFIIGLGVLLIVLGLPYSLFGERTALSTHLLQLGGQIHGLTGTMIVVEFRQKSEKFANSLPVKYLRRYSMVALSVYLLQIYELVPRWILTKILNLLFDNIPNLVSDKIFGRGLELWILPIAFFVILFYDLLLWLWSRIDFIGSFEWMLINVQSVVSRKSSRLNYELMLNRIEWIDLGETKN